MMKTTLGLNTKILIFLVTIQGWAGYLFAQSPTLSEIHKFNNPAFGIQKSASALSSPNRGHFATPGSHSAYRHNVPKHIGTYRFDGK